MYSSRVKTRSIERRWAVGASSSFAERDERTSEGGGLGTYRVDAADTRGHEPLPAAYADDRGFGFEVTIPASG